RSRARLGGRFQGAWREGTRPRPPLRFAPAGRRPPPPVIAALAAAVTGPRGRWVTIAVWVALGIGGYVGRSHIGDVTAAGQSSFLPKGAESVQALEELSGARTGTGKPDDSGTKHEEVPAVIVFD